MCGVVAEVMSGWIKCSERMPDDGDVVLVRLYEPQKPWKGVRIQDMKCTSYLGSKEFINHNNAIYNVEVTHWMPLPEPPKP